MATWRSFSPVTTGVTSIFYSAISPMSAAWSPGATATYLASFPPMETMAPPGVGDTGGICGYNAGTCLDTFGNTIAAENYATTIHSNLFITVKDVGFNYFGDDV